METKSHYFWALKLPDEAKRTIHSQLTKVKSVFPFKRWVHESDYHITLAFLGYAEQPQLDLTVDLIGKALKTKRAFPLSLNYVDVFGKRNSPRIFWAGLEEQDQLYTLQTIVFKACLQAGFPLETRPFKPHITLARNWDGEGFEKDLLKEQNPFNHVPVSCLANEVVLYKTNIGKAPKYEAITNFLLLVE